MSQIGRYVVLREVGHGAMGSVYAASDPAIGRTVAIKTIRMKELREGSERSDLEQRLRREAQSAGVLSHPGIVTIFDMGEQGDEAYIVMEFVDGSTLEEIFSSKVPQHTDFYLRILQKAAEALDYAHNKGIIHRDIKPSNIMITREGEVKITDFGVAKVSASTALTHTGIVLGTPNYMSPEQAQALPIDGRSDQFSLAVLASRILTGMLPFSGPTLTAVLTKILWAEPEFPQANLHPSVQTVLRKSLAKDPQQRYATCSEFVEDLTAACSLAIHQILQAPGEHAEVNAPAARATGALPLTLAPSSEQPTGEMSSVKRRSLSMPVKPTPAQVGTEATLPFLPSEASAISSPREASPALEQEDSGEAPARQSRPKGILFAVAGVAALMLALASYFFVIRRGPSIGGVPASAEPAVAKIEAPAPMPRDLPNTSSPLQTPPAALQAETSPPVTPVAPAPDKPVPATSASGRRPGSRVARSATTKASPPPLPAPVPEEKPTPEPIKPVEVKPPEINATKVLASGVITWSGRLKKNAILVITDQKATIGAVTGPLPGIPVTIQVEPQTVQIRVPPGEQNGWKQLMLFSGPEPLDSITIRWTAVK